MRYALWIFPLIGLPFTAGEWSVVGSTTSPCRYHGYRDDCYQFAISNGTAVVLRASKERNYDWCWVFCAKEDNDEFRAKVYSDFLSVDRISTLLINVLQYPTSGTNPLSTNNQLCEVDCQRWGLITPGSSVVGLSDTGCNQYVTAFHNECIQAQSNHEVARLQWIVAGIAIGSVVGAMILGLVVVRCLSKR